MSLGQFGSEDAKRRGEKFLAKAEASQARKAARPKSLFQRLRQRVWPNRHRT
jgi:hypothetical protein